MHWFVVFIIQFLIAYFLIPQIVKYAKAYNLVDKPDFRKIHRDFIPALGGVAIAISFFLSLLMGLKYDLSPYLPLFIAGLILVLLGIVDDIKPQNSILKLIFQITASTIVVCFGDMEIQNLHGSFGVSSIPYWLGLAIAIFIFILFINAMNLIDGINGLAATLSIVYLLFFSILFENLNFTFLFALSISIIASLIAFLRFNLIKPIVFMGDTGSTLLGLVFAYFFILFIKLEPHLKFSLGIQSPYGIMLALFMLPLFDTFRVAFIRILKKKSPFSPDKTHIHHFLLRLDFPHYAITAILVGFNIFVFLLSYSLQNLLGNSLLVVWILGLFIFAFFMIEYLLVSKYKMRYLKAFSLPNFRKFVHGSWYLFFAFILFALPFQRWATSIPIMLFSLFWVIGIERSKIDFNVKALLYIIVPSTLTIVTILYYLFIIPDIDIMLSTLELRWLFFFFPLTLFLQHEYFDLKKWYSMLAFYLIGVLAFLCLSFIIWFIKNISFFPNLFTYQFILPSSSIPHLYYSILINFGIMTSIYLKKSNILLLQQNRVQFVICLILGLSMYFIQSKIGFITMSAIFISAGIIHWKQNRIFPMFTLAYMPILVIVFIQYFEFNKLNWDYLSNSSIEIVKRKVIWSETLEFLKANWVYGFGDSIKLNTESNGKLIFNAHNQWLDLWLEFGILGLLIYVVSFATSFYIAIKSKDFYFIGFLCLMLVYSQIESIWKNQTGVVFWCTLNTLFLLKSKLRIKTNTNFIKV